MNLKALQADPAAFRSVLLIDTDSGPQPFSSVIDPWQSVDFEALDAGWQRAAGQKPKGEVFSRGWIERGRGHSKSMDIGVMALWCCYASKKRLSGYAGSGDKDQAGLLRNAIGKLVQINPWLQAIIEVQNYRVINSRTGSTLEIISSDGPTSYGLLPDFVICDEVCHWKKRDLWDSLLSSSAKRSTCMLCCISNAGFTDDEWVWQLREAVRVDEKWYFSRLDGPVASWISQSNLDEQKRLLPEMSFRRLWMNEWQTGSQDFINPADLSFAFKDNLEPMPHKMPGYEYVAGLDIGIARNESAITVLGIRKRNRWETDNAGHGQIRLAFTKTWKPTKTSRINLQEISDTLVLLHERYNFRAVNADVWQAIHICQNLSLLGLPMVELTLSGKSLQNIATVLIESFADRRLDLYPHPKLENEIRRLRVEPRSYGFRLVSPSTSDGSHGDLVSSFQYALLAASEIAGKRLPQVGVISFDDGGPFDTPLSRALNRVESRNQAIQQEQEWLAIPDTDDPMLKISRR